MLNRQSLSFARWHLILWMTAGVISLTIQKT